MKIIVLIKQVPETANASMAAVTGTIVREGVESIVNPLDLYAIETALRLKEARGARVTALTMGPASAEKCLREAIAMGCDDGVLLSSPEFAGSDTLATSRVLSKACQKIGFDLILAGERATDGDTAQVGPEVAAMLDVPIGAYVSSITETNDFEIIVERLTEDSYETLALPYPCLLSVVKEIAIPRLPTLFGKQRARTAELPTWQLSALEGIAPTEIGLSGSPTRVFKIEPQKIIRHGTQYSGAEPFEIDEAVEALVDFLKGKNLLAKRGGNVE